MRELKTKTLIFYNFSFQQPVSAPLCQTMPVPQARQSPVKVHSNQSWFARQRQVKVTADQQNMRNKDKPNWHKPYVAYSCPVRPVSVCLAVQIGTAQRKKNSKLSVGKRCIWAGCISPILRPSSPIYKRHRIPARPHCIFFKRLRHNGFQ